MDLPICSPAEREEWEERAAIMEFDGGLAREEAEQAAWKLVLKRRLAKRSYRASRVNIRSQ
jgi:hypothetical protein